MSSSINRTGTGSVRVPTYLSSALARTYAAALGDQNTPGRVDAGEARALISTARDLDRQRGWFRRMFLGHQGWNELGRLFGDRYGSFTPEGARLVGAYLDGYGDDHIDRLAARLSAAAGMNTTSPAVRASPLGAAVGAARPGTAGVAGIAPATDVDRGPRTVIDWRATKPTWNCYWYPWRPVGGDMGSPIYNLFGPGGALEKYDRVTGADSQRYEIKHSSLVGRRSTDDVGWRGHCNNAAAVSCALPEPQRDVTLRLRSGEEVTFTKQDIAALLVVISENITFVPNSDFIGRRNNGASGDDPSDPRPHVMLSALQRWTSDGGGAFAADIDPGPAVWNYPFDKVKVTASPTRQSDVTGGEEAPKSGKTTYYTFHLSGTGYETDDENETRNYEGWVNESPTGQVTSGWLHGADDRANPDFLWRPTYKPQGWYDSHAVLNPRVNVAQVLDLYRRSVPGFDVQV